MGVAHALIASHGFRSVLLLSDSPAAIANASSALASLGLPVLLRKDAPDVARRIQRAGERPTRGSGALPGRKGKLNHHNGDHDHNHVKHFDNNDLDQSRNLHNDDDDHTDVEEGYELAMDFLVDVHLIGMCDGFVGKFSSNRARMGYSLMAARAPFSPRPFVSLDIPWCFGFACRKEGNEELKMRWKSPIKANSNRGPDDSSAEMWKAA